MLCITLLLFVNIFEKFCAQEILLRKDPFSLWGKGEGFFFFFLSFCKYNKKYRKAWLTQKLYINDNDNDDDDNLEDDP